MCLAEVYSDEDMNRIVEGLPEVAPGVAEVWKAVEVEGDIYRPIYDYGSHRYKPSISIAHREKINEILVSYWSGYHFFLTPEDALRYGKKRGCCMGLIIKCFITREMVTAVGRSWLGSSACAVVVSQAFFPTYPATEAKLEDFLAYLEQEQAETKQVELATAERSAK
jgi:hypothetical protein